MDNVYCTCNKHFTDLYINKGKGRTMEKWSKEKAWEWYNSRPWIRGFNIVPSDCSGWVEMWQEYNHAEKVETIRRELALVPRLLHQ